MIRDAHQAPNQTETHLSGTCTQHAFKTQPSRSYFLKDTKTALPASWQKLTPEQGRVFLPTAEALWLSALWDGRHYAKQLLV